MSQTSTYFLGLFTLIIWYVECIKSLLPFVFLSKGRLFLHSSPAGYISVQNFLLTDVFFISYSFPVDLLRLMVWILFRICIR